MERKVTVIERKINSSRRLTPTKLRMKESLGVDSKIAESILHIVTIVNKREKSESDIKEIYEFLSAKSNYLPRLSAAYSQFNIAYEIVSKLKLMQVSKDVMLFRTGQRGECFYFVLHGKLSLIAPIKTSVEMSEKEFIEYLRKLARYEEFELIERIRKDNPSGSKYFKTFDDSFERKKRKSTDKKISNYTTKLSLKVFEDHFNHEIIEPADGISSEEWYINRIKPISTSLRVSNKKRFFTVYYYHLIKEMTTGDCFGEMALETEKGVRLLTIITSEPTYLAYIHKSVYNQCILESKRKANRATIDFLSKTQLFNDVPTLILEKKILNHLVFYKVDYKKEIWGSSESVCKENQIALLKKGIFEITIKKSITEILHFISYYGMSDEFEIWYEKEEKLLKQQCLNYNAFKNTKHNLKLGLIKDIDILGLSDTYDPLMRNTIFTYVNKESSGEIFLMDRDKYLDIIENDDFIKAKFLVYIEKKKDDRRSKLESLIMQQINTFKKKQENQYNILKYKKDKKDPSEDVVKFTRIENSKEIQIMQYESNLSSKLKYNNTCIVERDYATANSLQLYRAVDEVTHNFSRSQSHPARKIKIKLKMNNNSEKRKDFTPHYKSKSRKIGNLQIDKHEESKDDKARSKGLFNLLSKSIVKSKFDPKQLLPELLINNMYLSVKNTKPDEFIDRTIQTQGMTDRNSESNTAVNNLLNSKSRQLPQIGGLSLIKSNATIKKIDCLAMEKYSDPPITFKKVSPKKYEELHARLSKQHKIQNLRKMYLNKKGDIEKLYNNSYALNDLDNSLCRPIHNGVNLGFFDNLQQTVHSRSIEKLEQKNETLRAAVLRNSFRFKGNFS